LLLPLVGQLNDWKNAAKKAQACNIGFGVIGAGRWQLRLWFAVVLQSGQDVFQFGFLLLTSILVFQLGFGSGRTIFKSPNNAKPCPLQAIYENPTFHNYLFLFDKLY
jgi:hypothetical protein